MKKFLLIFLFLSFSWSAEYVVIAQKSMPPLSEKQIRAIYLKKITILNNMLLVPVNLSASSLIRKSFEERILKMEHSRLKAYWTKQHYLGRRPPLKMKSQKSVKAFIKKIEGAIGYIEADMVDDEIKIIYKWRD
ncbi:hypothetical protein RZR97_11030 [Hydrogenimonas thermophila]|uniref:hypothetical protein n=1 Tax=Hydrogenimonas thermophila TaxID=223786 RepID=UPI00293718FC|nr:hypothetical protein [Hydrogenimonas thermophila]WOE69628.1 hypothetical protein RZR91_11040 [Hydrogenimonas thermophila]WOE72142.1 hypothetical protein RZR97_11030 [Hydrogenimonas thermophila]